MTVNTGSLRKILDQEAKKGYTDATVIGGLDKFLKPWLAGVAGSTGNPVLEKDISRHFISSYAEMSGIQRHEWLKKALKLLDALEQVPAETAKHPLEARLHPPVNKVAVQLASNPPVAAAAAKKAAVLPSLDSPVTLVKGINQVLGKKFEKLGVATIRDLLYYFPHRHIDYSQRTYINSLSPGQENTIIASVWEAREVQLGTRRSAEATVGDETGNIRIVWFNQPYMAKNLKTGQRVVISGRVSSFNGMLQFESPEWEPYEDKDLVHTGRWVPVYPLTQGLSQRQVRRIIKPALDQWSPQIVDFLPPLLRRRLKLPELPEAIRQAHYPEDEVKKDEARRRLAFDELFLLQIGVLDKKRRWQEGNPGTAIDLKKAGIDAFLRGLPYKLTGSQERVLKEILADLGQSRPMSRLLQGEVGSGKTVVAAAAMVQVIANGYQCALMAPTEILGEQHFQTVRRLFSAIGREDGEGNIFKYSGFLDHPVQVALLTGDLKHLKKQKVQERINSGEIDLVIGTHALIQKGVEFPRLRLIVVDEQHRFGVEQRSALRQKGVNPHVLAMTATPIPRTLAMTIYGDLDISVIDELPPGRQAVRTRWLSPEQRPAAYGFIRKEINAGRQAFIICPLVEESEAIQARAAVAEYERLAQEVFPDLRLGLLHGRMNAENKEEVMQQFNHGELDILVSTPVIEVGIDVPNATVMLIESADRFGLSQLHQFRGRVGRGKEQSYCMLLAEKPSEIGKQRLDLIEKTQNGFALAEEDLKLRGPGEFFGTRQSGLPDLKMARLTDVTILELARNEAIRLYQVDPGLKKTEHRLLLEQVKKVWKQDTSNEWS